MFFFRAKKQKKEETIMAEGYKKNGIYVLNKGTSESVIYKFVDNETIDVTRELFLENVPGSTEDEFDYFKEQSDELFRLEENSNRKHRKYDVSLYEESFMSEETSLSAEEKFMRNEQQIEDQILINTLLSSLTETQKRRYILYAADGYTIREIADKENVGFTKVAKTIRLAQKKVETVLKQRKIDN